jgi:biotin-(acetyl-CoA carboxylase) ligase
MIGATSEVMHMNASSRGPQMTEEEAKELELARQHMLDRHKLIMGMIQNNEQQLKNESARGGAEIEREVALRNITSSGDSVEAQEELKAVTARLNKLQEEHRRLVTEREWLNTSLLEFESGPSSNEHHRAGHS